MTQETNEQSALDKVMNKCQSVLDSALWEELCQQVNQLMDKLEFHERIVPLLHKAAMDHMEAYFAGLKVDIRNGRLIRMTSITKGDIPAVVYRTPEGVEYTTSLLEDYRNLGARLRKHPGLVAIVRNMNVEEFLRASNHTQMKEWLDVVGEPKPPAQ